MTVSASSVNVGKKGVMPGGTRARGAKTDEFSQIISTQNKRASSATTAAAAAVSGSSSTAGTEEDAAAIMKEKLADQCQQLESIFVAQMFKTLQDSDTISGYMEKGHGEKLFTGMLNEERGENIGKAGLTGLGKMLYNQLVKQLTSTASTTTSTAASPATSGE